MPDGGWEKNGMRMVNDCGEMRLLNWRGGNKMQKNGNNLANYLHNSNNFRTFAVGNEK